MEGAVAAGSRRESTKERNREAILAAGLTVFGERGYGASTVRDLIRASGLSTGTFYNYFPDKESVFRELVERSAGELRTKLAEARSQALTPEAFVTEPFRVFFDHLAGDRALFALLGRNAGTVRTMLDDPILSATVDEIQVDLGSAITRGKLPAHDSEMMAAAMAGVAFELGLRMTEPGGPSPEEAAAFAASLFIGGLDRLSDS